jgi:phosphoadenosine phosphosulfate reductase
MVFEPKIEQLNSQFENGSTKTILTWAWGNFGGRIAATSSFQTQSVPLLHIISQTIPQLPILFLDTGFHFPETLTFRDRLTKELGLNVHTLRPEARQNLSVKKRGELYQTNPDLCCYINKVKPLQKEKQNLKAWITGIRRDQTQERTNTPTISWDKEGLYKICPMATWTRKDVWAYIDEHNLPVHPLLKQGYLSIGCAPCTRPVQEGELVRDGRWVGQGKNECGLHVSLPIEQKSEER